MNSTCSVQTDEREALRAGQRLLIVGMALGAEHDLMPCFSASVQGASRASFRWTRRATLAACSATAAATPLPSRLLLLRRGQRGWHRVWRRGNQASKQAAAAEAGSEEQRVEKSTPPRQTETRCSIRWKCPSTCDWPCVRAVGFRLAEDLSRAYLGLYGVVWPQLVEIPAFIDIRTYYLVVRGPVQKLASQCRDGR